MSDTRGLLTEAVRRGSARERAIALINVAIVTLAALSAALAASVWVVGGGRWIWLPPLVPFVALGGVLLLTAGVAYLGSIRAMRWSQPHELASDIEAERSLRRGSLTGLLQIPPENAVAARAATRLAAALPPGALAPGRERRERRALMFGATAFAIAAAGFTWSTVRQADALEVLIHPVEAARGDLLDPLELVRVPRAVARGAPLTVQIRAPDRRFITVHTRNAGSRWHMIRARVSDGAARVNVGPVNATLSVFASDARGSSDTAVVNPADRPFVRDLVLEAIYPRHLGRPPEPIPSLGPVAVPRGTTIQIRGRASVPLAAAELRGGSTLVRLNIEREAFAGSFSVERSVTAEWRITALSGEDIERPPALQISVENDALPVVEILAPGTDTTVLGDAPVRVAARALDDHELATVVLRVRRGDADREMTLAIPPAGGTATVMLDVSSLDAGERVVIDAIAAERGGAGRRVVSLARSISVMSAVEQRAAARSAADSAAALASHIAGAQRQVERRTAEVARARGERQTGGFDAAPAVGNALASRTRSLIDEQRGLSARADSLAAATRSLESRLKRAGALDEGLAARLAEVRSLLDRALTTELAARLRDAEQAARDDAEEPLRQALSDVTREQRRARDQLERVVQMLRRAAIEGSLETLRAEADDLAKQNSGAGLRELETRGHRLARDIGEVVTRLTAEGARAGIPFSREAEARASAGARDISRGSSGANGAFQESAEALAAARSAQIAEWKEELARDLDAAVQELVQLAAGEEALARQVAGGGRDWRPEQSMLEESAAAVAERVSRAARTSSLVSSRSDGLVRTARDRVSRVSASTVPQADLTQKSALMREAAASLSRAAASLVRDRERTNSARSASGFSELLEELQRLAREQRGLNAASAELPLALAGIGSWAARERARALGRQQRGLARSLEELGDADGGARAQPLAAEANRLADALEHAAVDASVIARQDRLYHRLLEGGRLLAGDSGDDEERRQAVTARQGEFPVVRESGVLPTGDRRHRVPGWGELRALTPVERQMIIEYFERLNATR